MKTIALLLACVVAPATVVRTIDGDTVVLRVEKWFGTDGPESVVERVRLLDVDAPELKGRTAEAGQAARAFTAQWLVRSRNIMVAACGRDSLGRILGRISNESGQDLSTELLAAGHAKRWERE